MQIIRGTLAIPGDPTPWITAHPNDSKEYCVLWLQGWKSTIEKHEAAITRLAEKTSLTFAMLDYAGHGSHPSLLEETTRQQQLTEVIAAYDALVSQGYKHIIVAGTSFGGYMTALLSAKREPYAIILRAPAIYRDNEFTTPQQTLQNPGVTNELFRKSVSSTSDLTALRAIENFNGSTYIIEHEIDSVIPKNVPHAYFNVAKRGNYLVIPATDHAVARMPEPKKHYDYIEQTIASVLQLILLEETVTS